METFSTDSGCSKMKKHSASFQTQNWHIVLVLLGFFLLNCHTCLNGSVVNAFFRSRAPLIEEYIPIDEELEEYRRNV